MKKIIKKFLIQMIPNYKSIISANQKNVVCSYITEGFLLKKNSKKLLTHGNRLESLIIRDVFNELGYNFYAMRYDKKLNFKKNEDTNVEIIFGIEPNFETLCEKYPDAVHIYYATGAYVEHQNNIIKKRTDSLNKKKNAMLPYTRLVTDNNAAKISDYIIQIGSEYTIETYPPELRSKIFLIRQSSFEFLKLDIEKKKKAFDKKNYLWFGSNGSVLKGLDLVLDYFVGNPNINLHIIGPIDESFKELYRTELTCHKNIIYHGYIPIYEPRIVEIMNKCSFIIYPSGSEGGVPGSVINAMKVGLIPIVSKYASSSEIKSLGYQLDDLDQKSIATIINKTMRLSNEELLEKFIKCSLFIENNYNSNNFKQDIRNCLEKIIQAENNNDNQNQKK